MVKQCTRCGECCKNATTCILRGWIYKDGKKDKFEPLCDQLVQHTNGTTSCKAVKMAIKGTTGWDENTRLWITDNMIGRGCELEIVPSYICPP